MRSAIREKIGRSGHSNRRGSALALAVLVILVLTVVGIAVAYFTQTEDKISGNAQLTKSALFAADAGLRAGEYLLGVVAAKGLNLDTVLNDASGGSPINLPGGHTARPLVVDGVAYLNYQVPGQSTGRAVPRYSIYIRNNDDDPGGPTKNTDALVNLISVGEAYVPGAVASGDRVLMQKILEEQVILSSQGTGWESTYKHDQGSTNASARGAKL